MYHRGRVAPCQDDTLHDLDVVLNRMSQGDCICILGNFNEYLQGNVTVSRFEVSGLEPAGRFDGDGVGR